MSKYSTSFRYGIIAGISMIAIALVIYFINMTKLASPIALIVYLPLIFLMIWGGITVRKEVGSFSSFGQAFITVFIVAITATMLFDTFGYVLYKVIDPELPNVIKKQAIENATAMMEKFGTSDDKTDEVVKQIQKQNYTPTIMTQLGRYLSSALVGAIFSAIIALFVRRPEEQHQIKAGE